MGQCKSFDGLFHLVLSIFTASEGEWFMELGGRKQEVGNRKSKSSILDVAADKQVKAWYPG